MPTSSDSQSITHGCPNIVPVPKKYGKIILCIYHQDLNNASPEDDLPLPYIHIIIDYCAKHEL